MLNNLSLNTGKDDVMSLHKKSKAKIISNSVGPYSADSVMQKKSAEFMELCVLKDERIYSVNKMLVLRNVYLYIVVH